MSTIFSKFLAARDAINAGEQLANAKTWANATSVAGCFVLGFNAVKVFVPQLEVVDDETFRQIGIGAFYVWGVVSIFVHPATVQDAGLPTKRKNGK